MMPKVMPGRDRKIYSDFAYSEAWIAYTSLKKAKKTVTVSDVWSELMKKGLGLFGYYDRLGKLNKVPDLIKALKHIGIQVTGKGVLIRRRQQPESHMRTLSNGRRVPVNKAITKHKVIKKFPSLPPKPMLAKPGPSYLEKAGWVSERKFDGFRVVAIKRGSRVKLFSRSRQEYTQNFPKVVADLKTLKEENLILDGEMTYLDAKGNDQFDIVQRRLQIADPDKIKEYVKRFPVIYFVFDILENDKFGENIQAQDLLDRKSALDDLFRNRSYKHVKQTEYVDLYGNRKRLLNSQKRLGREGVVHKYPLSKYIPDTRSGNWRKHKFVKEMDVIILGYQKGTGRLKGSMGALYVGAWDKNDASKLVYLGKIGTGFKDQQRKDFKKQLDNIMTGGSMIEGDWHWAYPKERIPSLHAHLNMPEIEAAVWVRHEKVIQVEFMELSKDRRMRHAVFVRNRPDKKSMEVII